VFQEMFPILSTPDLSRSLAFYRDLLAGEVTYQFPADGAPEFVALRYGPSSLGIAAEPDDGSPRSAASIRFALWVYVDDCDAAVQRLRADGVAVMQEPADQPWGERMATVADPDGNRVMVATR
jgi:lactoylglutathione lyase